VVFLALVEDSPVGMYRMCTEGDPMLLAEEVPDREKAV
jgi:hypothetical protein